MADYVYSNLPVHARHVPDYGHKEGSHDPHEMVELPGHVEIGVEIDGVFVPFMRKATAGLLKDVARAKAANGG